MKLVFLIVVVLCALLPETFGLNCPITTKAPISCAPKVTTKVPTKCAPKTTKAPTTCAPKTTKPSTTCAPKTITIAPLPVCGTNEVYSECGATGCVNTCAKPTFAQISRCACIPGCICIDGYLRNSKNLCVAPQQCDTCKENEEFSACDAHGCRNTCAEPDLLLRCTYLPGCYPGCICKEGFLKNADGVCVPEATCVNQCPNPNESYNTCGTACPKTCENKDKEIFCTFQCVTGCFCNDGYVRDANGVCILPESCPLVCGPNQVINECPACPAGQICPKICIPRCECIPGYIFDTTGTCTKVTTTCAPKTTKAPTTCAPKTTKAPTTCAPKTTTKKPVCGTNEVYSECGATGCVNTCANPTLAQISKCACKPGCICIDGYLRNSKKACVAPEKCDTCKENEEYSACDAHGCRNTCAEPDLLLRCSYVAGCYPGCICKEGFLKNANGVCVPEATCVNQCPNPNESYNTCGTACPKTCENKDKNIFCTFQCVTGCFCNDRYVRDANGVCILPESCLKTCPENEVYNECGTACPKTCKTKDAMIKCTADCNAACFCQEGYIRDKTGGKCIPERDCPLVCGPNQVINECPPCPKGQICAAVCIPRCECVPGYIFDTTGTCVKVTTTCAPKTTKAPTTRAPKTIKTPTKCAPIKTKAPTTCATKVCGTNEVYSECGATACVNTCANPTFAQVSRCSCKSGCICIDGYLRNSKDECVAPQQCAKKCPKNEVYNECGTACPKTCKTKDAMIKCTADCNAACFCQEGYIRDKTGGKCIPEKDCPLVSELPPCAKESLKKTEIPAVKECKKLLPVPSIC
nr:zonadhesin-like protein 4 [Limnephilus flavicornis]